MKIEEFEIDIQKHKDRSPETYNDIIYMTIPFYMFYRKMFGGVCQLEEEKYHMSHSELDVLSSLKLSGDENYIMSPTKLQQRMLFTSGAITKVLKKLEDKGYIIRVDNEYDKRSKLVQLTSLGNEVFQQVMVDVFAFEEKCFSHLDKEEQESFKNLLMKLLTS